MKQGHFPSFRVWTNKINYPWTDRAPLLLFAFQTTADYIKVEPGPAASIKVSQETDGFLDPTSSHRHDPVKQPTKGNKGRAVPYRSQRSKALMWSLENAKNNKNFFNVLKKVVTTVRVETHLKHVTLKIQKVTICTYQDCGDCVYCTRQTLCSHMLWVYLFLCKLTEASPILQQRPLTTYLIKKCVTTCMLLTRNIRS